MDDLDVEEFQKRITEITEKRYIKQRNPKRFYQEMPNYSKKKMAIMLALGFRGGQDKEITEGKTYILKTRCCLHFSRAIRSLVVLPWLYIGTSRIAFQKHELIRHAFTHVLNVTHDVENFHPGVFIYKVPLVLIALYFDANEIFLNRKFRLQIRKHLIFCRCSPKVLSFYSTLKKLKERY